MLKFCPGWITDSTIPKSNNREVKINPFVGTGTGRVDLFAKLNNIIAWLEIIQLIIKEWINGLLLARLKQNYRLHTVY